VLCVCGGMKAAACPPIARVPFFICVVLCLFASGSSPSSSQTLRISGGGAQQQRFLGFISNTRRLLSSLEEDDVNRIFRKRASTFFHRFDADGDRKLSREEAVRALARDRMSALLPGVSLDEFLSFMQVADINKDGALDHREFAGALNQGLETFSAQGSSFLQTDATSLPLPKMPAGTAKWLNRPKPGDEGDPAQPEHPLRGTGSPYRHTHHERIHAEADEEHRRKEFEARRILAKSSSPTSEWSLRQEQHTKAFLDKSQDGCIICQYAVERIEDNVHWAGIVPQFRGGRLDRHPLDSRDLDPQSRSSDDLELFKNSKEEQLVEPIEGDSEQSPSGQGEPGEEGETEHEGAAADDAFLEVQSHLKSSASAAVAGKAKTMSQSTATARAIAAAKQFPFFTPYVAGAAQLNNPFAPFVPGQPGFRSFKNAVDRQRFSEVYHVCDVTLDHICEASMPNTFYKHCVQLFRAQGAIANLVSRQYGVVPICRRLDFCGAHSYISRAVHNPESPRHEFAKKDLIGEAFLDS